MNARFALALAAFVIAAPACGQDAAVEAAPKDKAPASRTAEWVRFVDLGEQTGRLEVAIRRYADPARELQVDLIGVVHVGEPDYYAELMRRFAGYDAVLYELVAPKGTRPGRGEREGGFNPISLLQNAMKRALGLEFQLDGIDYEQDNFVHADLSPREIQRLWEERGDNLITVVLRMVINIAKAENQRAWEDDEDEDEPRSDPNLDLLLALKSKNRRQALKWALGRQLSHIEDMLSMFGGGEDSSGSVIVGERNRRAIEETVRQVEGGSRKLAIFYGAAHMPDMATRLQKALGVKAAGEEWLVAWKVEADAPPAPAKDDGGRGK